MNICVSIIIKCSFEESGWTDTYSLHRRYRLSPFHIFECCEDLQQKGVLEISGRRIRMTDEGREWVIRNRRKIFSPDRPWANMTPYLRSEKLEPSAPYLPNLSLLDEEFFRRALPFNKA